MTEREPALSTSRGTGAGHPGLVLGVARFYHDPRASMRGVLESAPGDARLLVYLLLGVALILAERLAVLAAGAPTGSDAFLSRAVPEIVSWVFVVPLFYYLLAALFTAVARLAGGRGSWLDGRAAFFWGALVAAPVVAGTALVSRVGSLPPPVAAAIGQIGPVFFAWALAQCYAETFGFRRAWTVLAAIAAPMLALAAAAALLGR